MYGGNDNGQGTAVAEFRAWIEAYVREEEVQCEQPGSMAQWLAEGTNETTDVDGFTAEDKRWLLDLKISTEVFRFASAVSLSSPRATNATAYCLANLRARAAPKPVRPQQLHKLDDDLMLPCLPPARAAGLHDLHRAASTSTRNAAVTGPQLSFNLQLIELAGALLNGNERAGRGASMF